MHALSRCGLQGIFCVDDDDEGYISGVSSVLGVLSITISGLSMASRDD